MPRDDRTYAQAMQAHEEEKKFLRKVRHRAFHPDSDRPLLFRLLGYVVRLVIFILILAVFLFVRNRRYFNGEDFADTVQEELNTFLHAEEGRLEEVYWRDDQAVTGYRADGGPQAYFRSLELPRIAARGRWRELLLNDHWTLRDVQIGDAVIYLKGGPTPATAPAEPLSPQAEPEDSWLDARPDFSNTRFGDIKLSNASFFWGPLWNSEGSLEGVDGTLRREGGDWKLTLTKGTLRQNWLHGLTIKPGHPLHVAITESEITFKGEQLTLGHDDDRNPLGDIALQGTIRLGERPDFDLHLVMEDVYFEDLLPEPFGDTLIGRTRVELTVTGSTDSSQGVVFDGKATVADTGKLDGIPIFNSVSIFTGLPTFLALRPASQFAFTTRDGQLTVDNLDIKGGSAKPAERGFTTSDGELLDFVRLVGGFSYQTDTSALEEDLALRPTLRPGAGGSRDAQADTDTREIPGFTGDIRLGMPWEVLERDPEIRSKFFTPDELGYGWITINFEGVPLPKDISLSQATAMDKNRAERSKKVQLR